MLLSQNEQFGLFLALNRTPQAVRKVFELDFSEQEKGTAMSREDIKCCETVESGIVHLQDLHYEMPLPFNPEHSAP